MSDENNVDPNNTTVVPGVPTPEEAGTAQTTFEPLKGPDGLPLGPLTPATGNPNFPDAGPSDILPQSPTPPLDAIAEGCDSNVGVDDPNANNHIKHSEDEKCEECEMESGRMREGVDVKATKELTDTLNESADEVEGSVAKMQNDTYVKSAMTMGMKVMRIGSNKLAQETQDQILTVKSLMATVYDKVNSMKGRLEAGQDAKIAINHGLTKLEEACMWIVKGFTFKE